MAWTPITVAFFSVIAVMLLAMTIYEIKVPCTERKGFLPISTTRGDRFFIGLLTSAYIHLAFLAVSDMTLLIPLVVSAIWLPVVLRWG